MASSSLPPTLVVIPSRMAAQRFPNKPLVEIGGKPMVLHVLERAQEADVGPVLVACGDQEIVDVVRAAGAQAILTDPDLPAGTDRVAAAAALFDPERKYTQVINVQGDQPFLKPEIIAEVARGLAHFPMSTPVTPWPESMPWDKQNAVKAVISGNPYEKPARALYFSRSRTPSSGPLWYHIGVYGFHRAVLEAYIQLPPSPLELQEKLEQLRALETGIAIGAVAVEGIPLSIDWPEDLEKARSIWAEMKKGSL